LNNVQGAGNAELTVFSGTVTLADPTSLPEGASPRNQNCDFNVGAVKTRSGLTNPFTYQNSNVVGFGNSVAVVSQGSTWNNPDNILSTSGFYTYNSVTSITDFLDVTEFAISAPPTETPQGFFPSLSGYATGPATLHAQLLKAGVPVGTPETASLNIGSPATVTLGGANNLFGATWSESDVNNINFGVRLWVTASSPVTVFLSNSAITVFLIPSQVNFNYVTTFEDDFGTIRTLALDANGQFWIENVSANPGSFFPAFNGPPAGSFASSFTSDSREYIAISDLLQGNYPPQQYTGQWNDRVSQVGPGATPVFTASTQAAAAPVNITQSAVSSNIVTLTANNTLTAGEPVLFAGLTQATFLNGQVLIVLGSGLSTTQFEVAFVASDYTTMADTGTATPQTSYPITTITQPAPGFPGQVGFFDGIEQSSGTGSGSPGSVVTVYTANARAGHFPAGDPVLTTAFNSGQPVYVYISGLPATFAFANGTQLVTSIGLAVPNFDGASAERWYFTFNVPTVSFATDGGDSASITGQYQITAATITTSEPVPGIAIGSQVTISGTSVSNYNSTWTITQTPNSGAMEITQTQVTAGSNIATYSYTVTSGANPTAGQLITITGTLNGGGTLNGVDLVIASVSGSTSGTFTIAGLPLATATLTVPEQGQGTTAGSQFVFDPGVATVGGSNDPIFGNSTGGGLVFIINENTLIGPGTRQGTVFFITRNGFWTAPAPPVTFNVPENTQAILASHIPIGPPNVIARGIVFTEGGSNGVPGASFYTIPTPVTYIVQGVTYTASSLFINDNTTTTATFSFPDSTLLNATEVDIQGGDLFNLEELPDAAWCLQYAGRTVWGRVRNQIQNFLNLSFDGGYLANPGGNLAPLGWTAATGTGAGQLLVSPVFGNSYYISNLTGGVSPPFFQMIYQSAFQDINLVSILQNQTAYSVRVTCRSPSSGFGGFLVIDLAVLTATGFGAQLGQFLLTPQAMTSSMATYEGTLLTNSTLNIPSGTQLRVYAANIPDGVDIEIDRIMIFPTQDPTNLTGLTLSYGTDVSSGSSDPESFDQVTGIIDTQTVNSQPANGGFQLRGLLYVVKESSLGYLKDTPNQEPANWTPFEEVSNVAGACGIHAYTIDKHKGAEWASMACQNGWYLFNGGAPTPIQIEIQDLWNSINWANAEGVCICNDIPNQKMYAAIPLPTPNPWMIDATVNAAPTSPNVILALDYKGMGTIDDLMNGMSIHMTMMGKLAVHDIRRKWSLWTIPTPFMGLVKRNELLSLVMFCNGINSSKIYYLDPTVQGFDDGVPFTSSYCTYGFIDASKQDSMPMFGSFNKRYRFFDTLASGSGTAALTFYQNVLEAPYPYVVPGSVDLSNPAANDIQGPLDEYAQRLFCEIVMTDGWFSMSRLTLSGAADSFAAIRGF
jgi:hypothetical protein